jgi:succinate dehydrogenase/fumarate reductase flavoprotein subunit
MKLLKNEKFLFFVGGVAATVLGKTFLKSKTAHKLAVQGVAAGMKIQKDALEKIQNIKEEASDLYMDSVKETEA